ncbi:MAG: chemotaxis protein, partial [Rhodospirillales bacterium]|nr:chemotaxis protein [Rhodospirillales bacterium]
NFPIDAFFESLASDQGDRSIGIVLSGTGSDGTQGIRHISEAGGLVSVQDPETAEFDGMPQSCIATGLAHFIQAPDQLARSIYDYVKRVDYDADKQLHIQPEIVSHESLAELHALLRADDGVDCSHYKASTIARRVSRRMLITGHERIEEYLRTLATDSQERAALRNDLLIGVTSFFRDPAAWKVIETQVIPKLVENADETLRIWVTACSTGEEVYTLGMLLKEALSRVNKRLQLKIFATDIDKQALEQASAGRYPKNIIAELGEERLARFFKQEGDRYVIRRELRESIIFSPHNLMRDAPFTKIDMVTCRNVLIYMQPELQDRVLGTLHFSLRQRGVLFLGSAETVGDLLPEFTIIDRRWKIFEKKRDAVLPIERRRLMPPRLEPVSRPATTSEGSMFRTDAIVSAAYRQLMQQMGGLCLVLSPNLQILHVFGDRQSYLNIPEGLGTTDVTQMLPRDLVLPLRTAVHRARSGTEPVSYSAIKVAQDDEVRLVNMDISAHEVRRGGEEFLIVLLSETEIAETTQDKQQFEISSAAAERIDELERELQRSRENLQATIEELETTNEEQQASNEELLASNEELQSTNEELHSVNEELYTVNAE